MARKDFDLIVIGSGLAGVSTAMHGARHGMSTLIIDRDLIGGTSTLMSAGHVMTGFLPSPKEMITLLGIERTAKLQQWSHNSKIALRNEVLNRLDNTTITDGYFLLGNGPIDYEILNKIYIYWTSQIKIPGLALNKTSQTASILDDSSFSFYLYDPTSYTIDRFALKQLLENIIQDRGIYNLQKTDVKAVREISDNIIEITTSFGNFYSCFAAICSGIRTPFFLPSLPTLNPDRYAVGDFTINEISESIGIKNGISASDCSHDPIYFTSRNDGSIHFGAPIDTADISNVSEVLRKKFYAIFPSFSIKELRNVRIADIDRTADGLPVIGLVSPRIAVAYGFSGVGLAASFGAGKSIADTFANPSWPSMPPFKKLAL
jgi:glycine/D-amino acid oxidase-like deaminating enzyme